jgi:hypothetical protein
MKKAVSGFLIALTLVFFATGAGAGTDKTQTPPKAPEGYIVVEEDVAIVLSDEHENYFQKAHQAVLKKNYKAAAADIRKAVAFLKLDAAVAAGEAKKALTDSVNELEKLADDMGKGGVTSAKALEQAFARADYALAKAYHLKASESWVKKATKEVGHSLKTAADNLEYGLAWASHKAEAGGKTAIRDARLVAGKLIEGTGWVPDEVGKGIEFIGKEVEKFGKQVEPPKR